MYRVWSKNASAESLYSRALAIVEKAYGPADSKVGSSLNNLAGLYLLMDNYAEAYLLFKRSLTVLEKALGS